MAQQTETPVSPTDNGPRRGPLAAIRRRMLLDQDDVGFATRGFRLDRPDDREHLECACGGFVTGYDAVMRADVPDPAEDLTAVAAELRGFAYEGAGMACAMLDVLTWSRGRRVRTLLSGSGDSYFHLVHVGVGFALAQLRLPGWGGLSDVLDPLMRWLALDGRGFQQGFFRHGRYLHPARAARPRPGAAGRVHDQGLGRSLWFVESGDVTAIADRIDGFHESRRADLWSGVGLAVAYAGDADAAALSLLAERCGPYRAHLAQGAVFAAIARTRSGVVPAHTERAVTALTSVDVPTAADWGEHAVAFLECGFDEERAPSIAVYDGLRALIRQAWYEQTARGS